MNTLSEKDIERRLTDQYAIVRYRMAKRSDFIPTLAQIERGLRDKSEEVRQEFEKKRCEHEARELKIRHASVVQESPKKAL